MAERKHIQHVKSNVSGKKPAASDLLYGEIAVNYAKGGEMMTIKNSDDEIVDFISRAATEQKIADAQSAASAVKEVHIGDNAPSQSTVDLFVDTSIDPLEVEIYSKSEIDTQVAAINDTTDALDDKIDTTVLIGTDPTPTTNPMLIVDTDDDVQYEVYTKAQVDAMIAKLKADNNLV